jgi:superfamily II DNA helicase RecQ
MIELRDYQQQAIRATHEALRRCNRVVLVMPTGAGKSHVTRWWANGITDRGRSVMFVTHRRVLIRQIADHCKEAGVLQICSLDTLQRRGWQDNPPADWVVVDEIHVNEQRYHKLLTYYPNAKVVGLTATPANEKGQRLAIAEEILEPVKNSDLIPKWLLPTRVFQICDIDTKGIGVSKGEWNQEELGKRLEKGFAAIDIWKHWEPFSDRQTIVWVPRVSFAHGLADQFRERGHTAEVLVSATTNVDRDDMFQAFRERRLSVIVGVQIPTIGLDLPVAECGIDLQPSRQLRSWWQKVGRLRRKHGDQIHCMLLDCGGNYWRHGIHPDEDPPWPLNNGDTTADLLKERKKGDPPDPWECPACKYTLAKWERIHDDKCPNCGHELSKAKRRILMGDGRMKEVTARRQRSKKQSDYVKTWLSCLYIGLHKNKSAHFAAWLFNKRTGKWPEQTEVARAMQGGMKLPPPRSSDWKLPVATLYPQLRRRG